MLQWLAEQSPLQLQRHDVERGCSYCMHRRCSGQKSAEPQRRQSRAGQQKAGGVIDASPEEAAGRRGVQEPGL